MATAETVQLGDIHAPKEDSIIALVINDQNSQKMTSLFGG